MILQTSKMFDFHFPSLSLHLGLVRSTLYVYESRGNQYAGIQWEVRKSAAVFRKKVKRQIEGRVL
jgi:hypothetical protein